VLLLAVDRKQAAILRRYCEGLCALRCWRRKWCVRPATASSFATVQHLRSRPTPPCPGVRAWTAPRLKARNAVRNPPARNSAASPTTAERCRPLKVRIIQSGTFLPAVDGFVRTTFALILRHEPDRSPLRTRLRCLVWHLDACRQEPHRGGRPRRARGTALLRGGYWCGDLAPPRPCRPAADGPTAGAASPMPSGRRRPDSRSLDAKTSHGWQERLALAGSRVPSCL